MPRPARRLTLLPVLMIAIATRLNAPVPAQAAAPADKAADSASTETTHSYTGVTVVTQGSFVAVDEAPKTAPAPEIIKNKIGMKLAHIPAGEFMMGSHDSLEELAKAYPIYDADRFHMTDEFPLHKVRITKPFYMGVTEVNIDQWKQFTKDAGYKTEAETDGTGGWGYNAKTGDVDEGRNPKYSWKNPGYPQDDTHPVVNITWNDANAFCKWLSTVDGHVYRLPTEAEWEYAARGGTTTRYYFGDNPEDLAKNANVYDAEGATVLPAWKKYAIAASDGFKFTAPTGSFTPNKFGLYDVHGNVWEWCSDWYGEDYYANSPTDDPQGPAKGKVRVRRGAAWHSWPLYLRVSFRNYNTPQSRYVNLGLRVVREEK